MLTINELISKKGTIPSSERGNSNKCLNCLAGKLTVLC